LKHLLSTTDFDQNLSSRTFPQQSFSSPLVSRATADIVNKLDYRELKAQLFPRIGRLCAAPASPFHPLPVRVAALMCLAKVPRRLGSEKERCRVHSYAPPQWQPLITQSFIVAINKPFQINKIKHTSKKNAEDFRFSPTCLCVRLPT
jgi:hypothetical protein